LLPPGTPVGPILSLVGLLIVAVVTVQIFNGQVPLVSGGGPGSSSGNGPLRTPAPSSEVIVPTLPPEVEPIPGTFVYAKAGNIWIQREGTATQLTGGSEEVGRDSMPSFSPDGGWIFFIRTLSTRGKWQVGTGIRWYDLTVPTVMRVRADGSGQPQRLLTASINGGGDLRWFYWLRQPVLSPNGRTIAVMSDGPDPTESNVVLQFLDLETKRLTKPNVPETAPLGHQDPAWRPDGRVLLFVRNGRDGTRGAPEIWRYSTADRTSRRLTNPGYLHPAWSRDQRWVAATKTTAFGTDVVILNPQTGAEVFRVTDDGRSWAPVFSPRGDAVAFLHSDGQIVDLHLVELEGTAPAWTAKTPIALTELSGLDTGSRPGWFIPEGELPPLPTPTPRPSASPSASG
jgi:Tol biopolymer transport system component